MNGTLSTKLADRMTSTRLALLSSSGAALLALAALSDALACACCTNTGQRSVGVAPFDSSKRAQIEHLLFAVPAQLYTGEAEPKDVKGITTPSSRYELKAEWQKDRLVFAFRDEAGRSGTLALRRPSTIAIFEVDPRDEPDHGQGPSLYKEWTLTARAAGTGVFSAGLGPSQQLRLIVHGRGNSCTSSDHFKHWSLEMRGPKASYTLFGDLVTTP
jgi:hypothetical protein